MNTAITISHIERKQELPGQPAALTDLSAGIGLENALRASAAAKDISEVVVDLTEARYVNAEVLHVDGDAQVARW